MQFTSLSLVLLAALAQAKTITVYSDSACNKQTQVIDLTNTGTYQCFNFAKLNAKSVRFSGDFSISKDAFYVWDAQYCAGDTAGSSKKVLNKCLVAKAFGYPFWNSASIGPTGP